MFPIISKQKFDKNLKGFVDYRDSRGLLFQFTDVGSTVRNAFV